MIDIHSHLLPKVDDGSDSYELSFQLLQKAQNEGITHIVLTPHFIRDEKYHLFADEVYRRAVQFIDVMHANGIMIDFSIGNELYIHRDLNLYLTENKVYTMGGTDYVLVEFPFDTYSDMYDEYLEKIARSGYRIIIAHPERYRYVQKSVKFVNRWLEEGYVLQSNQNSLFNPKTEKTVRSLIAQGAVSFIASDAHNKNRPCTLLNAYQTVRREFGIRVADQLFEENARYMLANQEIPDLAERKKKRLFHL